jgi:hypothetical protein
MRQDSTRQALGFALAVAAIGAAAAGCVSGPSAPPKPPSGGQTLSLSYDGFVASVEPVLVRKGCDAGGDCHGGGIRGTFELSPQGAKDVSFDFHQASMQVYPTMRDSSDLLRRPLADDAGGLPHPYKAFASTSDSDYVAIRGWIQAGVLQ